jgi:hypothetical protein
MRQGIENNPVYYKLPVPALFDATRFLWLYSAYKKNTVFAISFDPMNKLNRPKIDSSAFIFLVCDPIS